MRKLTILIGTSALLVTVVSAQQRARGLGAPRMSFPTTNPTTNQINASGLGTANAGYTANGGLGVTYSPHNGHYYASFRRNTASTANPHQIFEFDKDGGWVGAFAQPSGTLGSAWGIRDMAWDGDPNPATSRLYGGCEYASTNNTVYAYDPVTGAWDPALDVSISGNTSTAARAIGILPPTNPQFPGQMVGVITNWSDAVQYHDFTPGSSGRGGTIASNTPSVQKWAYGGTYDPSTQLFWWHGQGSNIAPVQYGTIFTQMDLQGNPTGKEYVGDLSIPATNPGGIAGGCEMWIDPATNRPVMTALTQAANDTIFNVYGQYEFGVGCIGLNGMGFSGPAFAGNSQWATTLDNIAAGRTTAFLWAGVPAVPPGVNLGAALQSCNLWLDPTIFVFGFPAAAPVTAGSAQMTIPIPAGVGGAELSFQWLVPGAGGTLPLDLSAGGDIHISI